MCSSLVRALLPVAELVKGKRKLAHTFGNPLTHHQTGVTGSMSQLCSKIFMIFCVAGALHVESAATGKIYPPPPIKMRRGGGTLDNHPQNIEDAMSHQGIPSTPGGTRTHTPKNLILSQARLPIPPQALTGDTPQMWGTPGFWR